MRLNTARNTKNKQKGFTVVEMLVVMIIIAALSAVLMPNFSASIDKAKEAKALSDFRTARINARIELLDNHKDTVKFADLVSQLQGIVSVAIQNIPNPNKTNIGKAIAESMGQEIVVVGEFVTIPRIELPCASRTSVSVSSNGNVYLKASHVSKEEGERLAQALGYGKLATPSEVASNPSLKNENIFWSSGHLSVGGHGGKPAGHLDILLYKP